MPITIDRPRNTLDQIDAPLWMKGYKLNNPEVPRGQYLQQLQKIEEEQVPILRSRDVASPAFFQATKTMGPVEAMSGLGQTVDYFTGAPARAGLSQALKPGDDPIKAIKALFKQYGKHPSTAPTGEQIASQMGVTGRKLGKFIPNQIRLGKVGGILARQPVNKLAGIGIEAAADLSPLAAMGMVGKAGKISKQGEKLSDLGKNPLLDEARKYKTADEFVASQGTLVYHGTNAKIKEFKTGKNPASGVKSKGLFFTDDSKAAKTYGDNVVETSIKLDNPMEIDFDGKSTVFFDGKWRSPSNLSNRIYEINDDLSKRYALSEDLLQELDQYGWSPLYADKIDGAVLKNLNDPGKYGDFLSSSTSTGYIILDESAIKTKKQLTDIWNKAQGKQ